MHAETTYVNRNKHPTRYNNVKRKEKTFWILKCYKRTIFLKIWNFLTKCINKENLFGVVNFSRKDRNKENLFVVFDF